MTKQEENPQFFMQRVTDTEKRRKIPRECMQKMAKKKLDTRFYCDNCKFFGHTRKECYHLIGYPKDKNPKESKKGEKDSKKAKNEVANQASTSTPPTPTFNSEEILLLKELLSKNSGK